MNNDQTSNAGARSNTSRILPGFLLAIAIAAAGWGYLSSRASDGERERTANALQLQVLASRLGVAAFEADYGDYATARRVASEAFDGIANYGIEQGALPRDYADVLAERDDVIAGLATGEAGVAEKLMALFFELQIPVDTQLDPSHILPAADSGLGLEPPRRSPAPGVADSAGRPVAPAAGGPVRTDTVGAGARPSARDTLSRRDTLLRQDTLQRRDTLPRQDTLSQSSGGRR